MKWEREQSPVAKAMGLYLIGKKGTQGLGWPIAFCINPFTFPTRQWGRSAVWDHFCLLQLPSQPLNHVHCPPWTRQSPAVGSPSPPLAVSMPAGMSHLCFTPAKMLRPMPPTANLQGPPSPETSCKHLHHRRRPTVQQ